MVSEYFRFRLNEQNGAYLEILVEQGTSERLLAAHGC